MSSDQELLDSAVSAAASLESLVSTSLGPHGREKVITSATGRVLVTRSGASMLRALGVTHVHGRLLVDTALAASDTHGEGASTLILIAGELLRQVCSCVETSALGRQTRGRLVRALARVLLHWLPTAMVPGVRESLSPVVLADGRACAARLARTAFSAEFPAPVADHLAELLSACWHPTCPIPELLPIVHVPAGSPDQSLVVHGVLVEGPMASPAMRTNLEGARVGLVAGPIRDPLPETAPSKVQLGSAEGLERLEEWAGDMDAAVARAFAQAGVRLVVCTQPLSPAFAAACAAAGLSAIACVAPETARQVSQCIASPPIRQCLPVERLTEHLAQNAGRLVSVRPASFGRKAHFLIQRAAADDHASTQSQGPAAISQKTLVIRAPGEGLALELSRAAQRGWKVLWRWTMGGERLTIPGGGAFEAAAAAQLMRTASRTASAGLEDAPADARVLTMVAEASLAVPRHLHGNERYARHGRDAAWPARRARLLVDQGAALGPGDPVELFEHRSRLLRLSLELVLQMLRVDMVVSCGRRPREGERRSEADSDSGSEEGREEGGAAEPMQPWYSH